MVLKQSLSKIGDTVSEPSRIETELNDAVPGDIRDTSTPKQLAFNLKEYVTGDILSDDKKEIFIDWMSNNATGDELIRAGVQVIGLWQIKVVLVLMEHEMISLL